MRIDSIDVTVGKSFSIPLRTFATAGYLWKITYLPEAIRQLEDNAEGALPHSKPGGSFTQVFQFQALEAGDYTVRFGLSRPWETKERDSRELHIHAT